MHNTYRFSDSELKTRNHQLCHVSTRKGTAPCRAFRSPSRAYSHSPARVPRSKGGQRGWGCGAWRAAAGRERGGRHERGDGSSPADGSAAPTRGCLCSCSGSGRAPRGCPALPCAPGSGRGARRRLRLARLQAEHRTAHTHAWAARGQLHLGCIGRACAEGKWCWWENPPGPTEVCSSIELRDVRRAAAPAGRRRALCSCVLHVVAARGQ